MKKSNVYTLTGDNGTTSLVGGKRILKSDIRLEAYGTVDEVNSFIGILSSNKQVPQEIREYLLGVQSRLFDIGGYLATEAPEGEELHITGVSAQDVSNMEQQIDMMDDTLPKLNFFILPSGNEMTAMAHVCRSTTRRAERRVIALAETTYIDPIVIKFLNRLSDYFFVLARFLSHITKEKEIPWQKS